MRCDIRIVGYVIMGILIVALAGCATTPTRESTGESVDDSVITAGVKDAILKEPLLKDVQINVSTYRGRVDLGGVVDTAVQFQKAEEVARRVPGVTSVWNNLVIKMNIGY